MTTRDLVNIFLRLEMAQKDGVSDLMFDSGAEGQSPFSITGVRLDEDGDVCLESDVRVKTTLSPKEIADAVSQYDGNKTVYFLSIDKNGEPELYNIKDGGTKDRFDNQLRIISCESLIDALGKFDKDAILHFESGTINFTINSVYMDPYGSLCLESNEIMELDDYPISMIMEDLSGQMGGTGVYFYDDDSKEFYGIYPDEYRIDDKGELWINVR